MLDKYRAWCNINRKSSKAAPIHEKNSKNKNVDWLHSIVRVLKNQTPPRKKKIIFNAEMQDFCALLHIMNQNPYYINLLKESYTSYDSLKNWQADKSG